MRENVHTTIEHIIYRGVGFYECAQCQEVQHFPTHEKLFIYYEKKHGQRKLIQYLLEFMQP